MAAETIRVKGLGALTRAMRRVDKEISAGLRAQMLDAGRIVAVEAAARFDAVNPYSAAGYRPRVRAAGYVVVEQSRRRTTGLRGDYGSLQMRRALLPALGAKQDEIVARVELLLDTVGLKNGF